jgi:hypothetical protein
LHKEQQKLAIAQQNLQKAVAAATVPELNIKRHQASKIGLAVDRMILVSQTECMSMFALQPYYCSVSAS